MFHSRKYLFYIASEFSAAWIHLFQIGSVCGVQHMQHMQPVTVISPRSTGDFEYGILNDALN